MYKSDVLKSFPAENHAILTMQDYNLRSTKLKEEREVSVVLNGTGGDFRSLAIEAGMGEPSDHPTLRAILEKNGYSPHNFARAVYDICIKRHPRINCLLLSGPSGTGKSILAKGIVSLFYWGDVDRTVNSVFRYERLRNKGIALQEECHITPDVIDDYKQLWGGEPFFINMKNKTAYLLERIPVIATTNKEGGSFVNAVDLQALMNRTIHFKLNFPVFPPEPISNADVVKFILFHLDGN